MVSTMPDLWETILANSTLPDAPANDLWIHLNNSGGGTGTGIVLFDGLEIEMDCPIYDVELDLEPLVAEVEFEVEAELESTEFEAEVCDG